MWGKFSARAGFQRHVILSVLFKGYHYEFWCLYLLLSLLRSPIGRLIVLILFSSAYNNLLKSIAELG